MATKTNLRNPPYSWGIRVDSFLDDVTPRNYLIAPHAISYGFLEVFVESEVKKETQVLATALSDVQKNTTQKTLAHTTPVNDMELSGGAASTTIDLLLCAKNRNSSPNVAVEKSTLRFAWGQLAVLGIQHFSSASANGMLNFSNNPDLLVNTYFEAAHQACGTAASGFGGAGNDWLQRMEWLQFTDRHIAPNIKSMQNTDRALLV